MKLKQTILLLLVLMVTAVFAPISHAQTSKPKPPKSGNENKAVGKASKSTKVYVCEHCKMASDMKGKCPTCQMDLKAQKARITYECDQCKTSMKEPGKCSKCGMDCQKMATYYACEKCKTTATKGGKCPKCGMKRTQMKMKMG